MSYLAQLQIDREPFSTSPDPNFFFKSREHRSILNRLEIAIRLKRGLSVVLGDIGVGKTTLSRALLQSFAHEGDEFIFHLILDPSFTSEKDLLQYLTKSFGISPFFQSSIDHRQAIEKYLFQKTVEEGKTVILLIDEGQKLSLEQLEVLRTLLNYETNDFKLLQLVIFGQMELLPKIKQVQNFLDRISTKCRLHPLAKEDVELLIQFRLRQAGLLQEQGYFSESAIHLIAEFTQGYPRKITRICHQAMEYLLMEQRQLVDRRMIEQIIQQEEVWGSS